MAAAQRESKLNYDTMAALLESVRLDVKEALKKGQRAVITCQHTIMQPWRQLGIASIADKKGPQKTKYAEELATEMGLHNMTKMTWDDYKVSALPVRIQMPVRIPSGDSQDYQWVLIVADYNKRPAVTAV